MANCGAELPPNSCISLLEAVATVAQVRDALYSKNVTTIMPSRGTTVCVSFALPASAAARTPAV